MTPDQFELHKNIEQVKQEIVERGGQGQFILDKYMQELYANLADLKSQCTHHYVDGVCEICGKREG